MTVPAIDVRGLSKASALFERFGFAVLVTLVAVRLFRWEAD